MHKPRLSLVTLLLAMLSCATAASAQTGSTKPTSSADRLFLAFIEDATVVERQWWEGQAATADWDSADVRTISGVVALQPWLDVEVGGRVGFGDTDADSGPDGSGATDLDLWAKYYLGGGSDTEFAVGGVVTIPTGDETAGLGSDAFGVSAFGALRHRLERLILAAHAGLQLNGDGRRFNEIGDRDGNNAAQLGVGVIFPFSDSVAGVGELAYRDGRLDGDDDDTRVLGGINWRPGGRGIVRGAIGFGLSDGAPDFQAQIGYAARF